MTSKLEHRTYWKAISKIRLRAGTTALALTSCLLAFGASAKAQTLTTLFSFDSTDGSVPVTGLVQGTDGNFYGTTLNGGANGDGTVFKITASGTLTTLHSFDGTDGEQPYAALIQATDGNLYGTTDGGGANGQGTVFKITRSGTLTTLYNFCSLSGCTDGEAANGLIQATDGNFYGTALFGGANGQGTVFKITPSGSLTTLYTFCAQSNCTDGSEPFWGLVEAADGNFYGTTSGGGANGISNGGYGTVFKITSSGTLTTLYSFCSQSDCTDGIDPYAGLVQATNGNFYGTTTSGGANINGGTVFRITSGGTLTTLYSFCSQSGCTDGGFPATSPVQATDGNFYGTSGGGTSTNCEGGGCGTVYKITPEGTFTSLLSFDETNGAVANAPVQGTDGNLYGTTGYGGTSSVCGSLGCGTAFSLSVGLRPFVEPQTTSGKVGSLVKILGTDLAGATSVTFNGTSAVFTIESKSAIAATVPAGATSGEVEVVTSFGTLKSNVPFRVQP
jgi:uncharacterized repeat protein (TIGR03803 family)